MAKKLPRRSSLLSLLLVFSTFSSIYSDPFDRTGQVEAGEKNARPTETAGGGDKKLADILLAAERAEPGALARYIDATDDSGAADRAAVLSPPSLFAELETAAGLVRETRDYAHSILGNPEYDESFYVDMMRRALQAKFVHPVLAAEAVTRILDVSRDGDKLKQLRDKVLEKNYAEQRRGKVSPGARLAWNMIRVGMGDSGTKIDPASLKFNSGSAEIALIVQGLPVKMAMSGEDLKRRVAANVDGYDFETGWTVLFQKPLGWMASLAKDMRRAGVLPGDYPRWEAMEGPGGLIAVTPPASEGKAEKIFFEGRLYDPRHLPPSADAAEMRTAFFDVASALTTGVMGDESIPSRLRQALRPILEGTHLPIDSRDYFDAAFCRRLVEADYLEAHLGPLSPERAEELARYREVLGRMENGSDLFAVPLADGRRLVAVQRPELDVDNDGTQYDMETGETLPRYGWRIEAADSTTFFSPLPSRQLYAFYLAEHYPGRHRFRPAGVPELTEVWHAVLGKVVSYRDGAPHAEADPADWQKAILLDAGGRMDSSSGPLGWNYPLHVLQRDDQGDPVLLATLNGVVPSPDFSGIADEQERRQAQDEWLDQAAGVLVEPGELGLIYHQFFRYCSDSPLPETPNLIGSHYGLSDTHQTVYQTLERRWVGRLIGDCDDLAEFFQVLAARQGRLSHVMQLPGHAATGFAEEDADGGWRFVVLQTGPVLRFSADSLESVVEKAYRYFDDDGGRTHFTAAAVPLLLRFADEETRTPFVLSSRIYADREYAEAMIRIQGHWHLHVYSAAIREMEEMIETDRDPGNLKELSSLYERVGQYDKSAALRREELDSVSEDYQATLSTLLDVAQLYIKDKNRDEALATLGEMEELMREKIRAGDAIAFARSMSFRAYWAILLSRLDEPVQAWQLVQKDVEAAKLRGGRASDSVLRTLVSIYDRMSLSEQLSDEEPSGEWKTARRAMEREMQNAFRRGFFKSEDSYNAILNKYFVLGRYAVAREGREKGLAKLLQDGPYPVENKDHGERRRNLTDEDWAWLRIIPRLYLAYGMERLDREEYPELYDPEAAKPFLEDVARAVEKGTGFGSDVVGDDDAIKSELVLAFINSDLRSYNRVMTLVRSRDYASLYDDAATVFGAYCGLVDIRDFPEWLEAFHKFFPGRQNYFKAAYRALDKGYYDHALALSRATAEFFPDDELLVREAGYLRELVPELKERRVQREAEAADAPEQEETVKPAA